MTDEPRKRRPRARRAITPTAAQLVGAPEFAPVPRQKQRCDGWTYERQRAFVQALAETGTVERAAAAIGMTAVGAYHLRRQPGAEGFTQAWADALALGVERLTDVMMERAIHGVAIPIYHRDAQVGERRWYNDRLLMFALRHHDPDRYGRNSGGVANVPPHVRRALRAEWEAERVEQERRNREDPEAIRARIMRKLAAVHAEMERERRQRDDAPEPDSAFPALPPPATDDEGGEPPLPHRPTRAEVEAKWAAREAREHFLRDTDLPAADPQTEELNHRRHWEAMVAAGKIGKREE